MEELSALKTLSDAGLAGIVLVLIWVVYKLVTNHDAHLLDALERNTDAWKENAIALTRLTDKLDK